MGDPAQNQDDLMSRLQKTASTSTAAPAPEAGDDLRSRLQAVTGTTPINMVGPNGEKQQVAPSDVAAMRQKNFAVTPDNPGVVKAVDYANGRVNYITPQEIEDFHNAGNAIVQPDGSIRYPIIRDKNGVIGQDPLDEQKAHQKVYAALDADEKARNQKSELKDAAKAGLDATLYTAAGVSGASALGAAPEVGSMGLRYLGRAALPGLEEEVGKAVVKQGAKWAVKKAAIAGAGYAGVEIVKHTGLIDKLLELF